MKVSTSWRYSSRCASFGVRRYWPRAKAAMRSISAFSARSARKSLSRFALPASLSLMIAMAFSDTVPTKAFASSVDALAGRARSEMQSIIDAASAHLERPFSRLAIAIAILIISHRYRNPRQAEPLRLACRGSETHIGTVWFVCVEIEILDIGQIVEIALAIGNLVLADLAIEIANSGVVIDRCTLDLVQRIEAAGALVDTVHNKACDWHGLGAVPIDVSQRVEELVNDEARHVAGRGGA